jgi:hypothetical protein
LSFSCYGQELPLGALPMQFNSSFAGEAGGPRISSNFGYQIGKYNFSNNSRNRIQSFTQYISYDQFIPAIRSGIGITAGLGNWSGSFTHQKYSQFSVAIAPKISIKGKYTLSPSLDFYYNSGKITEISPRYNIEVTNYGTRAGFLFNTNQYYISYSIYVIDYLNSTPNTPTYYDSGRRQKFSSYLQLGYTFQKSAESNFSFTPQLTFRIGSRRTFYQTDNSMYIAAYNLNFRYKQFIWGLNNTGLHLGWQTEKLKLMLSNSLGFSNRDSIYTINLSFRYVFK